MARTSRTHLTEIAAMAPVVIALRMPALLAEAAAHGGPRPETARAVAEKTAALAEGLVAMQFAMAASGIRAWTRLLAGRFEPRAFAAAQEEAALAALVPVSRRVRANMRRLGARPRRS